ILNSTTPASAVAFMTLLKQDRLVNREACDGMRTLLDRRLTTTKTKVGTRSPFGDGLMLALVPSYDEEDYERYHYAPVFDELYSKLGLGNYDNFWEVALLVRTVAGKKLTYAAACLDAKWDEI